MAATQITVVGTERVGGKGDCAGVEEEVAERNAIEKCCEIVGFWIIFKLC